MHVTVAPECLRFYARLPQGARRAADQLLQDLAVDPAHPSILYEPLAETPDPRLRRVRLSKRFGAILWFGDGGEGARLMWVGPRDETSVRDALGRMAPFREGAAPAKPPVPAAPPEEGPDFLLDEIRLPVRMRAAAKRRGITTLRQLATIPPRDLIADKNVGRTSIARTRVLIEELLGVSWEELQASKLPPPGLPAGWDELRAGLSEGARAVRLDRLSLPARVVSYAERERLETVGDLSKRSRAELVSAKNFGRSSIKAVVAAVTRCVEEGPRRASAGLFESWTELLRELDPRGVVALRAGLGVEPETRRAAGEALGLSADSVLLEEKAILRALSRNKEWLGDVRARVDAALAAGSARLATLATDPWWAAAAAQPNAIRYVGAHVAGGAFGVVTVGAEAFLSRRRQETVDEVSRKVLEAAGRTAVPMPIEELRASVMRGHEGGPESDLDGVLAGAVWEALVPRLLVADEGGKRRVLGAPTSRAATALALLRASPTPMSLDDLLARTGSTKMPGEVLFLGPDLVGVERHFPRFAWWTKQLVPVAIEAMKRRSRGRQWFVSELFEVVRKKKVGLPAWLDAWHLGALLRRSGRVRWLSRSRVALLEGPDRMVSVRGELHRILRDHGGPMTHDEIRRALGKKTGFSESMLHTYLKDPPYLRCDADRIGLFERDLPGGLAALGQAGDHVAALLERRGRGLSPYELGAEVARLSPVHAGWTAEMCGSALRRDERFHMNTQGSVGLARWNSARVLPRPQLLLACLDKAGGRISVRAVQRRFVAVHGVAPTVERLVAMGTLVGAAVHGAWIVRTKAAEAKRGGRP
jgi:Bacterial RNA polymerase, alpha chain C terminal domain